MADVCLRRLPHVSSRLVLRSRGLRGLTQIGCSRDLPLRRPSRRSSRVGGRVACDPLVGSLRCPCCPTARAPPHLRVLKLSRATIEPLACLAVRNRPRNRSGSALPSDVADASWRYVERAARPLRGHEELTPPRAKARVSDAREKKLSSRPSTALKTRAWSPVYPMCSCGPRDRIRVVPSRAGLCSADRWPSRVWIRRPLWPFYRCTKTAALTRPCLPSPFPSSLPTVSSLGGSLVFTEH